MKTTWAVVCAVLTIAPAALAQSDFTVTKSVDASSTPTLAGNNVQFDVTVINNGPNSGAVTLDDNVPAGMTFVSVTPPAGFSCTAPAVGATSGTVSCSNASMAPGSAPFAIVFQIPPNTPSNTSFTNTATVTSATDTNGGNNSASATVSTPASSDLTITKTGPGTANADTDVSFNIAITNNGPDPATNVVIEGNITNGGHKVSGTGNTQSCSTGQTFEECSATLPAGESLKQTFFGIPREPQRVKGYAVATSDTPDPNSENDWDVFSFKVRRR
jgi:uncharacterized repeat protein (TIGR01451 family)